MKTRRSRSLVWDYFTKRLDLSNVRKAICKYCSKELSYKTSVTNLKKHLRQMHKDHYRSLQRESRKILPDLKRTSDELVQPDANQEGIEPCTSTDDEKKSIKEQDRFSGISKFIWKYFTKQAPQGELKLAKCKQCHKKFSYKTTVFNLKRHLESIHKEEYKLLQEVLGSLKFAAKGIFEQSMESTIDVKSINELQETEEDEVGLDEVENASEIGSFESYSELVIEPSPPKKLRKMSQDPLESSEVDETELMARMWTRKLRGLPEEARDLLIFKINNLVFGETLRHSSYKFEESGLTD